MPVLELQRPEIQVTKLFRENSYVPDDIKIIVNRGGTRSGKTYNIMLMIFIWLLTGKIGDKYDNAGLFSIARKYSNTISKTSQRDFDEIIDRFGMINLIKINKSDKTYQVGRRVVEFIGADDQQKVRGAKRDYLYCNEGNELAYKAEFFQLLIRTRKRVWIDFNPDDEDVWINTELELKRSVEKKDVKVIVSTYKDNPFLSKAEVEEIEYLEKTDPMLWRIYGLGEYGKIEGLIFPNIYLVENIPEKAKLISYGLDFGYTNDPTAMVAIYLMNGNEIYIDELIYESRLTNPDICKKLNELKIPQSDEIYADSSEPKSIEEIRQNGWNVQPAVKGPDSIMHGIDTIKRHHIYITERSLGIRKEQKKYVWIKDKNGVMKNKPIDQYNHAWDAVRYAIETKLGVKEDIFIASF